MFIVIDGIDGSGKSTIIDSWANTLAKEGKKVFSLKSYWQEHHEHPRLEELLPFDVIVSAEPTTVWVGAAIRKELVVNNSSYSPRTIAEAFALDRLILQKRLIVPLYASGKIILQDRGVSTSLCYQPLTEPSLTMNDVAHIEGNAFSLEHAPDHLVIVDVGEDTAIKRIGSRYDKRDNALFEQKTFLAHARARYLDAQFQSYFTRQGTRIHLLDGNTTRDILQKVACELLKSLMSI